MTRATDEQAIAAALTLTPASNAWQRTVDITATGAKSGLPRRIEIWFHQVAGRWYLSSTPSTRAWHANLLRHPRFVFHLKHGVQADLPAAAVAVTDEAERRRVLGHVVDDLNQPHNPGGVPQPQRMEDWLAGSPLVEVVFDERVA